MNSKEITVVAFGDSLTALTPGQAGQDRIARPMIALLHRQLFK